MMALYVYRCRYCDQPPPDGGEWGVGRRCPKHPKREGPERLPPYMQECEFCPIAGVERDPAVDVVRKLQDNLALLRDALDSQRDLAQAALDGSHNWLAANWPSGDSSIAGFIPEPEEDG